MSDSLPPLPDDLARLFAKASEAPEREELLTAVRERVSRAMVLRGVPGFGPDDAGTTRGSASGAAGAGMVQGRGGALVAKSMVTKVAALAATAGLAIGLGAGHEWGARQYRGSTPTTVENSARPPVVAPLEERAVSVESLPSAPSIDAGAERIARSGSSTTPAPVASAPVDDGPAGRSALRRERELVDGASGALRSGNAEQALDLSNQAAKQFPHGQLSEEREIIAIEALLALGRHPEARIRTDRFRAAFPRSLAGARLSAKTNSAPP